MAVEAMATAVQLVKLVLAIIVAVTTQYIAIKVFDKLTKGLDEVAEIRKGNTAVGILMASVIIAVAAIIAGGVGSMMATTDWFAFLQSFMWLIVSVIVAVGAVFVALATFMALTEHIDEERELRRGNVAVALVLGALVIALAVVIQAGMPRV